MMRSAFPGIELKRTEWRVDRYLANESLDLRFEALLSPRCRALLLSRIHCG